MFDSTDRRVRAPGAGSATLEALLGAAAVVLAVLGLLDLRPVTMAELAAIAVGGAMLLEGAALSSHYQAAAADLGHEDRNAIGGGVTAEFLAGAAGIALGVLAMLGIDPNTLIPIASLVLGAGLLFGGGLTARARRVGGHFLEDRAEHRTAQATQSAGSAEVMVGAAGIALGILALLDVADRFTLALVGFLALGAAVTLGGAALTARLTTLARHGDLPGGHGPMLR